MSIRRSVALSTLMGALLVSACSPSPAPLPSPDASTTPSIAATASATPSVSPVPASADFYVAPGAVHQSIAQLRAEGRDADADLLERAIASQPQAIWVGDWLTNEVVEQQGRDVVERAAEQGAYALFVMYAIPGRDCGLHSAGGLPEQQYLEFIESFASGIEGSGAWVILEPDALAQLGDCEGQGDRAGLLAGAARILDDAGVNVYLDAGNSNWLAPEVVVSRLQLVGVEHLEGFSLNVSNYNSTPAESAYGDVIAAATGLDYVIDTSRNGNGGNGEWCNVRGQALGEPPRVVETGNLDAVLWIKRPGESDGTCGGAPPAGNWWLEVALELAANAEANAR